MTLLRPPGFAGRGPASPSPRCRSTAVMARRDTPSDSLDFFPTPPWATRALLKHALPRLGIHCCGRAVDPCCGQGHMVGPLSEFFSETLGSDIFDYGHGRVADFLNPAFRPHAGAFVFNPPFNLAIDFVLKALELNPLLVAAFVRNQFVESEERYARLYATRPPLAIAHFSERVALVQGCWAINASSATAYSWFIWAPAAQSYSATATLWIPPGRRKALTRYSDFETYGACSLVPIEIRRKIDAAEQKAGAP